MGRPERKTTWKIGSLNVHSIMNKTSGVITHLEDKGCDVCLVQETYLKQSDTAKLQEIRDYGWNIFSSPRAERSGGGIGILYRDGVKIKYTPVKTKFKSFQVQEALIGIGQDLTRLCNIYRPPYTGKARFTEAQFLDEFTDYLSELVCKTGHPFLMGDFNFQVQDTQNFYARKLLGLLDSLGFDQLVPMQPTHVRGGTLDLLLCQKDVASKVQSVNIFPEGTTSDHFMVLADLSIETTGSEYKTREQVDTYRDFRAVDMDLFRRVFGSVDWSKVMESETAEDVLHAYVRILEDLVERTVPLKRRKKKGAKLRPWRDNPEVREVLRLRRKAERAWEDNRTSITKKQFNELKRQFGRVDKEARTKYVKDDLEESRDDPKALQRKLSRLLGNSETFLPETSDKRKLADDFADFFVGKVEKIRSTVMEEQNQRNMRNAVHQAPVCCFEKFEEVSTEKLKRIVKDMPDKTCDLDPVPTWLVKGCIDELATVLCKFVNLSLGSSSVPEILQQALVFPTIKNQHGDKDSLTNYRPVSNLPFISKLLEKVVLEQLNSYLNENELLNQHQSGYRVGHSCETLLMGMFDDLLRDLDDGKVTGLFLLDMSAAFDTVDHSKLLEILEGRFGVKGSVLDWFASYLQSRTYRVNVDGELSRIISLVCGVPQGSLLGPVLFLLYVEELQDLVRPFGLRIKLYADDSQLYISLVPTDEDNWNAAKERIEECLASVKLWMSEHWLKCNEAKTEFLLLGKNSALDKMVFQPTVNFGGVEISPMEFTGSTGKTLGVFLDSNLSMERQINSVKKQCGMLLKNLWQVNKCLDKSTKLLLVKQLIISRLDYCNILYSGLPKKLLDSLQRVLNSCVRFVYGLYGHQESYMPYLREMHVLPIEQRVKFKVCLMAYKIVHGLAPGYLLEQVPVDDGLDVIRYTTRGNACPDGLKLKYPKLSSVNATSKLRRRRPSVNLPEVWNKLSLDLRAVKSVESFKSKLKTSLFIEAFGES